MAIISVIVPVFNAENYLSRCIDSILSQSFTDFELILVNDGSTDQSASICDQYAKNDCRITVIHKRNGGVSSTRNAGLDYALNKKECEWISFVDSDDWIHKKYLEFLYKSVTDNKTDVSICSFKSTDDFPGDIDYEFTDETDITEKIWTKTRFQALWGRLYRKTLFNNIRFPEGKIYEDAYTTYKVIFQCKKVSYVPLILYYYYQSPNSIMRSEWNIEKSEEYIPFQEQVRYFKTNHYYEAAKVSEFTIMYILSNTVKNIPHNYPNAKKIKRRLLQILRREYRSNKDTVFLFTKSKAYFILSTAYPLETKIKHYIRKKIQHLKQLLKRQ